MPPPSGEEAAGPGERRAVSQYRPTTIGQQDLNRHLSLPPWLVAKWMQAARMPFYRPSQTRKGPEQTRAPHGDGEPQDVQPLVVVGSQVLRLARPGALSEALDKDALVTCEVGAVGRSTVDLHYRVLLGDDLAATGTTVLVRTARSRAAGDAPGPVREAACAEGDRSDAELLKMLRAQPRQPPAVDVLRVPMTVRYSDEDVNRHANHSTLVRFFEDAREIVLADTATPMQLRGPLALALRGITVAYAAELHAGDMCEVCLRASTSPCGPVDVWVDRVASPTKGAPLGVAGRGQMCFFDGTPEPVWRGAKPSSRL